LKPEWVVPVSFWIHILLYGFLERGPHPERTSQKEAFVLFGQAVEVSGQLDQLFLVQGCQHRLDV
jgi:hypothetical protein